MSTHDSPVPSFASHRSGDPESIKTKSIHRLEGVAHELGGQVAERMQDMKADAGEISGNLRDRFHTVKKNVVRSADSTSNDLRRMLTPLYDYAEKHPGRLIVASIALGWFLGALRRGEARRAPVMEPDRR